MKHYLLYDKYLVAYHAVIGGSPWNPTSGTETERLSPKSKIDNKTIICYDKYHVAY